MEVFKQTSQFTLKAALTGEVAGARCDILDRARAPGAPRGALRERRGAPALLTWRRADALFFRADAYFGEEGGAGGFVSDDDEDWCARGAAAAAPRRRVSRPHTVRTTPRPQGERRRRGFLGHRGRRGQEEARAGHCALRTTGTTSPLTPTQPPSGPSCDARLTDPSPALRKSTDPRAEGEAGEASARAQGAAEAPAHGVQQGQPDAPPEEEGAPEAPLHPLRRDGGSCAELTADEFLSRRQAQVVDPYELVLIKMPPPPLPTSWGRVIAPYKSGESPRTHLTGPHAPSCGCGGPARRRTGRSLRRAAACIFAAPPVVDYKKIETKDIFSLDPSQARARAFAASPRLHAPPTARPQRPLAVGGQRSECSPLRPLLLRQVGTDFLGVLLNPPWKMFGAAAGIKASALSRLRLPQLCPHGAIARALPRSQTASLAAERVQYLPFVSASAEPHGA